MAEGDRLLIARMHLGQQDGGLVGVGAQGNEVGHLDVARRNLGQLFGQIDVVLVGIEGGRV